MIIEIDKSLHFRMMTFGPPLSLTCLRSKTSRSSARRTASGSTSSLTDPSTG